MKIIFENKVKKTAEDIWVNYYQLFDDETYSDIGAKKIAKQCALIAVDEIIKVARDAYDEEVVTAVIIYWNKVKQEIKKL